ncbi:MAG TPA: biotin/lipoyl-binding protein [Planctomycetota bacterium]|nr:biotin/lipoyl-binding protein [Planctomycetota bacterium]
MIRILLLPLLALAGGAFAVITVAAGSQPAPIAPPVADPSRPPFDTYIAGSGILEAMNKNVAIGAPLSRLVLEVNVQVGDEVAAGAPLFRLDDRDAKAELAVRKSAVGAARAKLDRLKSAPRLEEIPPAEARVAAAEAQLADLRNQVTLWESVADKRAVTVEDLQRRKFAVQAQEARLAESKASLVLLKAGSWKPDIDVAEADLANAEAQAAQTETELSRLTVRAPSKGEVLQVNVRAGEFAPAGALQTPLMLFGPLDRIHLRVDVDENDAWRFRKDASAVAFVRGNRELKTALRFECVEPYVIPKRSLTGDSTERVDTRVMQAVYSFERGKLPVYVGQQMDVFIDVKTGAKP